MNASSTSLSLLAFCLGLSLLIFLSPWDHRALYVIYTFALSLGFLMVAALSDRGSFKSFLLGYALISLGIGAYIFKWPNSFFHKLMISGREWITLGILAGLVLGGIYLYRFLKSRKRQDLIWTLGLGIGLLGAGLFWGISWRFQFPEPGGSYAVGTQAHHLVDEAREELFTKKRGDRRELMLQFFYPGVTQEGIEPLSFKDLRRVQTRSYPDLSPVEDLKMPVVLYAAGAGGSRFDNTSQAEALASRGYFVATLDHTYFNATRFPDGRVIRAFSMDTLDRRGSQEFYLSEQIQPIFVADLGSALKELTHLNEDPESQWYQRLDLDRVGVMGWSLGGSAAVEMCVSDPRFKAGVCLDGWGWMKMDSAHQRFQVPFLYMRSDVSVVDNWDIMGMGISLEHLHKMDERQNAREATLMQNSTVPVRSERIAGAFHSNLRDQGLIRLARNGPVDPVACNQQVTEGVVDFFDQYLME